VSGYGSSHQLDRFAPILAASSESHGIAGVRSASDRTTMSASGGQLLSGPLACCLDPCVARSELLKDEGGSGGHVRSPSGLVEALSGGVPGPFVSTEVVHTPSGEPEATSAAAGDVTLVLAVLLRSIGDGAGLGAVAEYETAG